MADTAPPVREVLPDFPPRHRGFGSNVLRALCASGENRRICFPADCNHIGKGGRACVPRTPTVVKLSNQELWDLMDEVLRLRYPPVALKFVEREEDAPVDALRPKRDMNKHIALCQAFALARRQGRVVYMRKEDQWCWNPMITYGMVEFEKGTEAFDLISSTMGVDDPEKADDFVARFPRLPYQKYDGVLIAPLQKAEFAPDILLTYCRNSQMRVILMGLMTQTGAMLDSSFTPLDSCVYSVVPPFLEGKYRITLPDPGEYERALTGEDEIIFTVPYQKWDEFCAGMQALRTNGNTLDSFYPMMKEDFSRPPFYNRLFTLWGLDTGEDWDKPAKPPKEN